MSSRKALVEHYFEGFRRSDHPRILSCLTDDVVWDIVGFKRLSGKSEFDQEIEGDQFEGSPTLTIDRLVDEADTVVALGNGEGMHKSAGLFRFAFCTVFTFAGDKIRRVESYIVPLAADTEHD